MRNLLRWLVPLLILMVITAGVANAGTTRSPLKDTICDITAGSWCYSPSGIQVEGSTHPVTGDCSAALVSFIGWDLSDISGTIATAQLTLTTYFVIGAPATPVEIQLFAPTTHDWTENGDTVSPGSSGATLATTSVVLNDGWTPQTVVFGGATNPTDAATLGAYLNSLKSPGPATVGVRIASGNCGPVSVVVAFNDREDTGSLPGGATATEPDLLLFDPTAISLSFMDTGNPNQSFYTAALVAVALLLSVTLVAVYRVPAVLKRKRAS